MKNDVSKKKTSREKRILIASLCIATAIAAGSTFAWFSSKDEVTNRLTAAADYGVAVGENFEPPENWIPGQTINKDAGAVNTGSIDAFVRMWLSGQMRALQQNKAGGIADYNDISNPFDPAETAVTDSALLNAGLKLMDDDGNYYKLLDTTQTINPKQQLSTSQEGYPDASQYNALSEVQSMQSGILAYAPDNAEYTYILNQETVLPVYVAVDGGTAAPMDVAVPAGTLVHVGGTAGTAAAYSSTTGALTISATEEVTNASGSTKSPTTYNTVYVAAQTHDDSNTYFNPVNVEYETFTPLTDGLYLFLRNEENVDEENPEFSGYYRSTQDINDPLSGESDSASDASTNNTGLRANDGAVYYALNTNTSGNNSSDYTVMGAITADHDAPIAVTYDNSTNPKNIRYVVPTGDLELYTAKYNTIDADDLIFTAGAIDTTNHTQTIYAIYNADGTDYEFTPEEDIIVEINLANVGEDSEQWTGIGAGTLSHSYDIGTNSYTSDASKLTFYYNNDVEAGDSSAILVDSVKLYDGVTNQAYLAFDFDLNVNLESVQVTYEEDGKEKTTPVNAWAATQDGGGTAVNTGAQPHNGDDADTYTDTNEISVVGWENIT